MQTQYKTVFLNIHIANLKVEFQECFKWFIDQYGACTEQDRINNKELMKREWDLIDAHIPNEDITSILSTDLMSRLYASTNFSLLGPSSPPRTNTSIS